MDENMPKNEMDGASNQGGQNQSGAAHSADNMKAETKNIIGQLEATLDEYMVKKAPFALPPGLKEFIVKVAPYLIIIMAVLAVPVILFALGLSTAFAPSAMMMGGGYGYGWGGTPFVSGIFSLVAFVVELMAVPGLFKRTQKGWRLVFYASLISLVGSILSFNIIGGIIGAIIGWYVLFQIKDMYKN